MVQPKRPVEPIRWHPPRACPTRREFLGRLGGFLTGAFLILSQACSTSSTPSILFTYQYLRGMGKPHPGAVFKLYVSRPIVPVAEGQVAWIGPCGDFSGSGVSK